MQTLTILDAQSQEPLVILGQNEVGALSILGGDESVVDKLGLHQYNSLEEMASYVNQDGSNLQAIMNMGEQPPKEPEDPGMDERIQPAIDILKELLQRAGDRQKSKKDDRQDQRYGEAQETMGAEVLHDKPHQIYVSMDGDNIGNGVARAEEQDDEEKLAQISQRINAGQDKLQEWTRAMGGVVIEAGGDEGLVRVPSTAFDHIEELRQLYYKTVGATVTVGVGNRISESTKARMLGKLRGKNQVVVFDPSTEQELELRLQDTDQTESAKLRTAMRPNNIPAQEGDDQATASPNDSEDSEQTSEAPEDDGQTDNTPPPKWSQGQSGQEVTQSDDQSGQDDTRSGTEPAESDESAPDRVQSEDDSAEKSEWSPDLMKHMNQQQEAAPQSVTGNVVHDPDIEKEDFSDRDDPAFAKGLWYSMKHGRQ